MGLVFIVRFSIVYIELMVCFSMLLVVKFEESKIKINDKFIYF